MQKIFLLSLVCVWFQLGIATAQELKLIPPKGYEALTDADPKTFITLKPETNSPYSKLKFEVDFKEATECIIDKILIDFVQDAQHPLPSKVDLKMISSETYSEENRIGGTITFYIDSTCMVTKPNFVFLQNSSSYLSPSASLTLKFYHKQPIKISSVVVTTQECVYDEPAEKPVIYLYPPAPTDVTVQAMNAKAFTFSYPVYPDGGWKFKAYPDGTLQTPNGRSYPYLFWEGISSLKPSFKMGYCVPRDSVVPFLEEKLRYQGLNDKELTDCITYWAPRMAQHPFTIVYFANQEFQKEYPLHISPKPDSHLAIFMIMKPSPYKVNLKPQPLAPFDRKGFSVIEWGGRFLE